MRTLCLALAATLAGAGAMVGGRSHAAVMDPNALPAAADELAAVELVAFTWRGRRYCWYPTGWRGPGWYRCGFRWRRGLGWGGPSGWHGWRKPGIHRPGRPGRPGINRPGGNRPGINRPGGNRPGINRPGGNRPGINRPGGNRPGANRPGNRPGGNRPGNRPDRDRSGAAAEVTIAAAARVERPEFAIREAPMTARLDARVPHEVFYIQQLARSDL